VLLTPKLGVRICLVLRQNPKIVLRIVTEGFIFVIIGTSGILAPCDQDVEDNHNRILELNQSLPAADPNRGAWVLPTCQANHIL
jgi:hypothetical protein